ncbi:MAG: GTP-binding protein [Pigmentiphaga sp.]|nr:GTP-binding protein [Pigmentiphaga sp.]
MVNSTTSPDGFPITVLTGFLGSGKTTLLKEYLAEGANQDTAVIINEFGEVGLDHHLVEAITDDMVVLSGGCICCSINGDLPLTLERLHQSAQQGKIPPFKRVLIETTGLADPAPVIQSLILDKKTREHFYFDQLISTVDATQFERQLARHLEIEQQLMLADVLILTKTDCISDSQRTQLIQLLGTLQPHAPLLSKQAGQRLADALEIRWADPERHSLAASNAAAWAQRLTGSFCTDPGCNDASHSHFAHNQRYQSTEFTFDAPLAWEDVSDWLASLCFFHGERILRMKGILQLQDEPRPVVIHGVHQTLYPSETLASWGTLPRRSSVVFITEQLEKNLLTPPFQ